MCVVIAACMFVCVFSQHISPLKLTHPLYRHETGHAHGARAETTPRGPCTVAPRHKVPTLRRTDYSGTLIRAVVR